MKRTPLFVAMLIAMSSLYIAGCDNKDEQAAASQQQMPPPVVNVMPVRYQTIPLEKEYSGRTTAYQKADVRPQATGIVKEIKFNEGGLVEQGQPLYRLSIDNYESTLVGNQAAVSQAQANVNTAKASYNNALANSESQKALLAQAQADLNRFKQLVEINAVSQQQYDQAVTKFETAKAAYASSQAAIAQAQANIESAQAAVNAAQARANASQIDLNRTIVTAPISGVTDRSNVTIGALVNANQPEPLVTISNINPIYVDIQQSSAELLALKKQQASGALQPGSRSIELILEDGSVYPTRGQLMLGEANVDEASGSVTLRARFENNNYLLLPGMFVTARLTQGFVNNAVLLPQSAVIRTPKGEPQVRIVDAENKIQIRPVTISGTYEGNWVVTEGLNPDENVVIIGSGQLKPDQEVVTQPYTSTSNDTQQTGAAPASGSASMSSPTQGSESQNQSSTAQSESSQSATDQTESTIPLQAPQSATQNEQSSLDDSKDVDKTENAAN